MLRVTVKGLLAHKLRMALSAFAVVLGVAFVAGSLVFTDTLDKTFTELTRQTAPDVTVRPVQSDAAKATGYGTGAVTADLVDQLAALPGVARADGWITDQGTYVIGKNGKVVGGGGAPGLAGNYDDTPAADGAPIVTITQGSPPTGPGQLLLDEKTAAAAGYSIGDTVRLVLSGEQPAVTGTLVGTLRLGTSGTLAGATLVQMDTPTAQQWYLQGRAGFHQIAVTDDGSLSNQQLRDAVAAALPPGIEALDDRQVAAENQHQFQDALAFITTFLLLFAAVALVVGDLPDPQHLLHHRRPTHPGTGVVPGARRDPPAAHPVGAAGGAARRPGRLHGRAAARGSAGPRADGADRERSASTSAEWAWSSAGRRRRSRSPSVSP